MLTNTIHKIVDIALQEDIGSGDITASLIPSEQQDQANIITRQNAIVCGIQFVNAVYTILENITNNKVKITWQVQDGDVVEPMQTLCTLTGSSRALLTGERCALNFLQTLSSTATLTNEFVMAVKGTNTKILDTRKTLPGLRNAQKYAVKCGGGYNHRFGLYDAILIKENHIMANHGSITRAVTATRNNYPNVTIEVEVTNLEQLKEALALSINCIMLDNFNLTMIKDAVKIAASSGHKGHHTKLEASGNVNLTNVRAIAETGVDYISIGTITKTVIPIDFSMLFAKNQE